MQHCDAIIIGGGMAGIGCAAMLAQHASVVVVEAEDTCGYHSTGRSAAIFIPSYGGPEIRSLTHHSEAYFDSPPDELGIDTVLTPRGELLLAVDGEEDTMRSLLSEFPGLEELSAAEARALVPILREESLRGACLERAARDIDVDLLFQAWSRLLRRQGGRISLGQPARSISHEAGSWRVDTGFERFIAPTVINAAGAWADLIADLAGVGRIGLSPCRRSAAVLPAPDGHKVDAWPLFGSVTESWYAKPLGGKLMVSPADEEPVAPHDTFADDMVLAEGLHRYEQVVTTPVTRVEHSWAGLRTFAPDRIPVTGFATDADGFFWLAGQGGYGIQTAPAMSRLACSLLTGQSLTPAMSELAGALSPERFLSA